MLLSVDGVGCVPYLAELPLQLRLALQEGDNVFLLSFPARPTGRASSIRVGGRNGPGDVPDAARPLGPAAQGGVHLERRGDGAEEVVGGLPLGPIREEVTGVVGERGERRE